VNQGPAGPRHLDPDLAAVDPEILARLASPPLSSAGQAALIDRATAGLQALFGTAHPVLIFPGSLAVLREALIRLAVTQRALVLVAGWSGESLARTVEACGKEVIRLCVPVGATVEPEQLRRFLAHPPVDAVLLAHAEAESGAVTALPELSSLVHGESDRLLLVDAVDTWGAQPVSTDQSALDLVLSSSERALGLPPGLAFAVASPQLLDRFRNDPGPGRGEALDPLALFTAAGAREWPAAPSGLLVALDWQLQGIGDETISARYRRHQELRDLMDHETERLGWRQLARPDRRALGFSVLLTPPEHGGGRPVWRERLAEEGWVVGAGMGRHAETTFRVSHAHHTTPEDLRGLLLALGRATASARG
jgi:aspartate aminotransferase-like enzyme